MTRVGLNQSASCIDISEIPACKLLGASVLASNFYHVQMSLYEDLVAAWVPAKHEWLKRRPLGEELVATLGKKKMFSYCACM